MNKILLLFICIIGAIILALEIKIGALVTIPAFSLLFLIYFAKPKFIIKSKYWERVFKEKGFLQRVLVALCFFVFALFINHFIGVYVEGIDGPALSDIILDNLKPIDFGPAPVYLFRIAIVVLVVSILFIWPTKAPFSLKSVSLLIIVRSLCLPLTHLGLPLGRIPDDVGLSNLEFINFTKDLFFSGHVAYTFFVFLLFEKQKTIKYFMLINSIILSFIVLAMHLHYSIDVVAAFFFAYGTYKMATFFFKKDYELHRY